ncbi:MAG TPA: zf-HC2 domain-containing protein [Burkholderiales bacterium]|nr:zf-HC2 domain-containing protein [Burkholderiales bacterium]
MLSCKEVTRLVSQGLDRPLSPGERLRVRLHFLICRGCARFERQMAFLRLAVRRLGA